MADGKHTGLYIPRKVVDDWQISAPMKLVLAVMLKNTDKYGICSLTGRKIGEDCGMMPATVSQNRKRLERNGYIEKIPGTPCNFRVKKHWR